MRHMLAYEFQFVFELLVEVSEFDSQNYRSWIVIVFLMVLIVEFRDVLSIQIEERNRSCNFIFEGIISKLDRK